MKIIFVCSGNTCRSPLAESMTQAHKDLIFSMYGRQSNVFTLNEDVCDTQEIDDPFGGSFDVYEQTYTKIYDLVDKIKFKHE